VLFAGLIWRKILRSIRPKRFDSGGGFGILLSSLFVLALFSGSKCQAQTRPPETIKNPSASAPSGPQPQNSPASVAGDDRLSRWQGLPVRRIAYEGVLPERLTALDGHLPQQVSAPLNREKVAGSLRQLFSTGLFDSIEADALSEGDGVALVFRGSARMFIGVVTVEGAKGATVNTQLQRASRLNPGSRFNETKMDQALNQMKLALGENGYHEAEITYRLDKHQKDQLVDVAFHVVSGPQARVGNVAVSGDPGMSMESFRHHAHLKPGAKVDHDTANRALTGLLKEYRNQKRLEAEIKLESQSYVDRRMNYKFTATKGPVVRVLVQGAPLEQEQLKRLVPVFEEGSVDDDLLNEGNRRLRDFYQTLGYFDVKVDHHEQSVQPGEVAINYVVQLGTRRHVESVKVDGNHYFDSDTLEELLSVHPANLLDKHGAYNQALVSSDVGALQAVYQNNGFSKVKVTPETSLAEPVGNAGRRRPKPAALRVVYHIEEGRQQRVGNVKLDGNGHVETEKLLALLNSEPGQLLSPRNLAGDRDALVTDYLSRGFDQAQVQVEENDNPTDPTRVDVSFHITEGKQIFVRNVLLTGLHFTRPDTITRAITVHPGDPLNQSAILETQRNLYEFALFNEVNAAVQNPNGSETTKTILLHAVEARRWTLTYGAGFEAQTGTPQNNCRGQQENGVPCSPNGRTGISPRVLLNVTRNNLFGREQSASLQGTYGLLEQKVNVIFENPHFLGNRNFGLTFNGGYANSRDVTTYVASRLDAGFRVTQGFTAPGSVLSRANTFIYEYNFRRVKVEQSSLQVFPNFIKRLATAVRVGGPGFTWIRDTRDSPIDAHRGTYTSLQEFLSAVPFGAEAQFNRLDLTNSSFYGFDKNRFVLARNTRYGQERAFGSGNQELIPLPERLYGGGATSMRGFAINAAGPRDPQTGFPIGGAGALINNTELRLPPPTLPYFGNSVSFVIFHDMGNVFGSAGDAWVSAIRIHQPDRDQCKQPQAKGTPPNFPNPPSPTISTGPTSLCGFNYFSHAPGMGMRYHTPVGPIRLDFSYNLNPPIYPITYDYAHPTDVPHVGQAGHFNFFFSLGQTF
jgi:outer membrane protein insertion porin family